MQRLFVIALILILLDGCKLLGVGKQCYTCQTQYTLSAGSGVPKDLYSKDVCGNDERKQYIDANTGLKNGVYLITTCTQN